MTSTSDRSSTSPEQALAAIHRAEWGRLLALLVSRTRRLDLAEDALGEAFARAAARWPSDGVPPNPGGWLYTTAYRQVVGRLRSEAVAGRSAPLLAVRPGWVSPTAPEDELSEALSDERLHLILLCCHPALSRDSQSALALRLVVGTTTEQIARLFLVPTATMAARLTRAKKKIAAAGIPLGAPVADELDARLDEVCRTVYLAFTAGYTPSSGSELLRADLAGEAVMLAGVLQHAAPDAAQVRALRALLVLQHSRRHAREHDGSLVTLQDQDRTLWRQDEIRLGLDLLERLHPGDGYAEELRLQALIAAEHVTAPTPGDTNWEAIAGHYAALGERTGSPIVGLNRAVALAESQGPQAGLALLAGLDESLRSHHRFAAVCGGLAARAGDTELAAAAYRSAIELCSNDVEREHLRSLLAGVEAADPHR
jgi:RNA polymerase sigma-70 factor (ECF subfamily)